MRTRLALHIERAGPIEVRPEKTALRSEDGRVRLQARVEGLSRGPTELWFDFVPEDAPPMPDAGHAWVLGLLFVGMQLGRALRVHAPLCPRFLENLQWFMDAWHAWAPDRYQPIPIEGQAWKHTGSEGPASRRGVMLFSGGLDSCRALHAHLREKSPDPRRLQLVRALLVEGADFPWHDRHSARTAADAARRITQDVGLPLARVRTNLRDFDAPWVDAHGALLAACLHLYADRAEVGLIASTAAIDRLDLPWGSHPLTDRWLGSSRFDIMNDTLHLRRVDKLAEIAGWRVALDNLRVCYSQRPGEMNCGHCQKCVFTRLMCLAVGARCATLPEGVTAEDILSLWKMPSWSHLELRPLLRHARRSGRDRDPIFLLLRLILLFNRGVVSPYRALRALRRQPLS